MINVRRVLGMPIQWRRQSGCGSLDQLLSLFRLGSLHGRLNLSIQQMPQPHGVVARLPGDFVHQLSQLRPLGHVPRVELRNLPLKDPPISFIQCKRRNAIQRNQVTLLPALQCRSVHVRRAKLILKRHHERADLINRSRLQLLA